MSARTIRLSRGEKPLDKERLGKRECGPWVPDDEHAEKLVSDSGRCVANWDGYTSHSGCVLTSAGPVTIRSKEDAETILMLDGWAIRKAAPKKVVKRDGLTWRCAEERELVAYLVGDRIHLSDSSVLLLGLGDTYGGIVERTERRLGSLGYTIE